MNTRIISRTGERLRCFGLPVFLAFVSFACSNKEKAPQTRMYEDIIYTAIKGCDSKDSTTYHQAHYNTSLLLSADIILKIALDSLVPENDKVRLIDTLIHAQNTWSNPRRNEYIMAFYQIEEVGEQIAKPIHSRYSILDNGNATLNVRLPYRADEVGHVIVVAADWINDTVTNHYHLQLPKDNEGNFNVELTPDQQRELLNRSDMFVYFMDTFSRQPIGSFIVKLKPLQKQLKGKTMNKDAIIRTI